MIETGTAKRVRCDECGASGPWHSEKYQAREAVQALGWLYSYSARTQEERDLCSACKGKSER